MKSHVFFSDLKVSSGKTLLDKLDILIDHTRLKEKIREKDLVAIKLHFGERGNTGFVRPIFLRRVVDRVKQLKGKPFLTDTNTLYTGTRSEAVSHLTTASGNGFTESVVNAPLLIADGLRGNSAVKVQIDKPIFKTVSIAQAIYMADVLISVAHFKGHELTGFAGALKNLGMGCSSREGKLSQHSNISPRVKRKACKGCELCLGWCPQNAIAMVSSEPKAGGKHSIAFINSNNCIGCGECILSCPSGAIRVQWNETLPLFQKKMVEHAYGALQKKEGKTLCLNFLMRISPACDCHGFSDTPIVNDIGILSSEDPVAIDQASVDLVNGEMGNPSSKLSGAWEPGENKFRALYPEVDWKIQLDYAEQIGLGTREYELIKI
ncbi:MAG: 4Fe-4S ferredoxin [Deltaproteobacteria bacterium RBG_13_47_9]|nr:MAG: 4Fe-4S ferredoxin [Deltaproteobacteria bacterium RBG_13_47_9]